MGFTFLSNLPIICLKKIVKIKIAPIKTPIEGTVGMSIIIAIRCPIIQLKIAKTTDIMRKKDSFLVIKFAKEGGITIRPITIIAPTLSKLKTVDILVRPSKRYV